MAKLCVFGHGAGTAADQLNSRQSFERVRTLGCDGLELDVRRTLDDRLAVIHDPHLADGRDVAQTASYDLPSQVMLLEDVLDMFRGLIVNIEIKTEAVTDQAHGGIVDKTLELVRRIDMIDQIVISSFDPRALAHARELVPGVKTASLYNAELQEELSPQDVMAEVASNGFNLSRKQVDESIIEACHRLERPVAVYTVNDINEMERILDLGVDAIFTDHPDRLLEVLADRSMRDPHVTRRRALAS